MHAGERKLKSVCEVVVNRHRALSEKRPESGFCLMVRLVVSFTRIVPRVSVRLHGFLVFA